MSDPIHWRGIVLTAQRGVTVDTLWVFLDAPAFKGPISSAQVWKAKSRWHAWLFNNDDIFHGETPQAALDTALRWWIRTKRKRIKASEESLTKQRANLARLIATMEET
jgi:hypothetical protein